jgi:hypothetical protein
MMRILIKIISVLIVVGVFNSCKTAKSNYYSYSTVTYTIDSLKTPLYSNHLISYGDYVIEFKLGLKKTIDMYANSHKITSIGFDTLGIYLISGANKLFYEFDTFAIQNKLVKTGDLKDKSYGQTFNFQPRDTSSSSPSYGPLKETQINKITCYVSEVKSVNTPGADSIQTKIILIKSRKFNSLYKINGIKFPDSVYCIVGFQVVDMKNRIALVQEIESMQPLKANEKQICDHMIQTIKSLPVDSLRHSFSQN